MNQKKYQNNFLLLFLFFISTACVKGLPKTTLKEFWNENKHELLEMDIDLSKFLTDTDAIVIDGQRFELMPAKSEFERAMDNSTESFEFRKAVTKGIEASELNKHSDQAELEALENLMTTFYPFLAGKENKSFQKVMESRKGKWPNFGQSSFIKKVNIVQDQVRSSFPGFSTSKMKIEHSISHLGLKKDEKARVIIITGPYGGGHISTANAISDSLNKSSQIESKIIDECDFEDTLFYKVTNKKWRYCDIYKEVQMKQENFFRRALLDSLHNTLNNYQTSNKWIKLYSHAVDKKPHLIISTVHHIIGVTLVAQLLNIPLQVMVTDYEFPTPQTIFLNAFNPLSVNFWIPGGTKTQFERQIRDIRERDETLMAPGSRTARIWTHMVEGGGSFESIQHELQIFEKQGFPLRSSFHSDTSQEGLNKDKAHLGLSPYLGANQNIVSLAYGSGAGGTRPIEILTQVLEHRSSLKRPLRLLFLTSGNEKLGKDAIDAFDKFEVPVLELSPNSEGSSGFSAKASGKSTLDAAALAKKAHELPIIGFIMPKLNLEQDMPALYRVSQTIITKPGGATSAEVIACRTPLLPVLPLLPWERGNAITLQELHLSPHMNILDESEIEGPKLVQKLNELLEPSYQSERAKWVLPELFDAQKFSIRVEKLLRDYYHQAD